MIERSPIDDEDDGIAYCCIPLQLSLPYVNQSKAFFTSKGYHMVITLNILNIP
jgi:hypothetical protein